MSEPTITWTRDMLDRFADTLERELRDGAQPGDIMKFDGHEFVVGYARYLLQYLDGKLSKNETSADQ